MRRFVLALLLLAAPALALAQSKPRDTYTQDDLKRAEKARDDALARLKALEARSAAAARDASSIDNDLVAAATDSTRHEEAAYAAEEQLMILADETDTARARLTADTSALDDLLAALMTFGSRRPPALAASPEDASAAVRAAILMSDAAPALSRRAADLKSQIDNLNTLAAQTRAEQQTLSTATSALAARRDEIAALAAEKRISYASLAVETAAARADTARLASEAETLRDLLDSLAKVAPTAPSTKPGQKPSATKPTGTKPAATAPATKPPSGKPAATASAKPPAGAPLQPAVGTRLHRFGQTIEGARQEGLTLTTRAAAQVVAPLDARVQYAGVFRTYGLMAILDVGGDVLVIVSGLDALYPEAGQWVLAGEPIGRMADRKTPYPELYLEVRRKGEPIDPEKWLGKAT
jgi:septal ring factor EnvC (AmiA/AmiB activator)